MKDDSIEGIYDTLKQCALISKSAGGIGLNVHCIRATGSYIGGTNGHSNGLVPMLRVYNNTARYVDQGGNKVNKSCLTLCTPSSRGSFHPHPGLLRFSKLVPRWPVITFTGEVEFTMGITC